MKLFNLFESVLIILLPLVVPIVWWLTDSTVSTLTLSMVIFVPQIIIAFSLFLLKRRHENLSHDIQLQKKYTADEQFISLYERSPTPYLTINRTGEIIMFNPATIKLFNATSDTLLGLNFYEMISVGEDGAGDLSIIKGKVDSGITIKDEEVQIKTLTGDNRFALMAVHVYDIKDQRLISLVDITEDKIIDTAKTEFVALATHQLRTPIAAIRWNLELLEKNMLETKTEDQARYLTKISRNTMRMIALINDFLSVSKLETGTFATKFEDINLSQFIDSIIDEFAEKISDKKLSFRRQDNPPDLMINSDMRLLHIIISNLISNAVKYVGVEGEVGINYEVDENNLIINIFDNGIGVPKQELENLFTKFFRASNAQSHQAEGTGLGLYIV